MRFLKWIRNLLVAIIIVMICAAAALTWRGYQMYSEAVSAVSIEDKVAEAQRQESYTDIEKLPQIYLDAVVAVEDHRFKEHSGIDIISLFRALWTNIRTMSFAEGGSTITQQLAKNLYFTQEKEITRKIAEMFMAAEMESKLSKDDILELYVNSIYFGNGCYDVGSASRSYFNKEPGEMSAYESTLLAGLPNAPSVYDLTENPDLAAQRQSQVVAKMVKHNFITSQEAAAILS